MRRRPLKVGSTAGSSRPSSDPWNVRERLFADMRSMFARHPRPVKAGGRLPGVPEPEPVDDPADPRLADYRQLTDPEARRRRERDVLFVAEGVTAIERLLRSGHHVRSVVVTPNALAR